MKIGEKKNCARFSIYKAALFRYNIREYIGNTDLSRLFYNLKGYDNVCCNLKNSRKI